MNPTDDPRVRWSPKRILLCWIVMGWSIQGQLTERFRESYELLTHLFYRRRRCGGTYQGLIRATQRVGMTVFAEFWHCLRQAVPQRVGEAWTWFGWTVFAVDGSRVDAPRTRGNERSLGRSGRNKTHPQWWITRLIRLPIKMMWDWRQGPGHSSERDHLRQMIPSLPSSSLLVADSGFGGVRSVVAIVQRQSGVPVALRWKHHVAFPQCKNPTASSVRRRGAQVCETARGARGGARGGTSVRSA